MTGDERKTADEDSELISSFKKGDIGAFEILVQKYQRRMLNTAFRMIGNYEEACETVQDVFVAAYKGIKDFKGTARFSTWLYSIVVNLSKNRLRQLKTRGYHEATSIDDPAEPVSTEPSIVERLEKRDVQQKVQECINALDKEFKEVIVLRDIQGFSYEEISNILNVAEGTVKSRIFRAREVLKNNLKNAIGDL